MVEGRSPIAGNAAIAGNVVDEVEDEEGIDTTVSDDTVFWEDRMVESSDECTLVSVLSVSVGSVVVFCG